MYNEEVKRKFISEFSTSLSRQKMAAVLFNTIEKYETQWGKDVCEKEADDLKDFITEICGFRVAGSNARINILKAYSKWCIKNGVAGACDGLLHIKGIGNEKLKRQTVANPKHLQDYLNCICDKESERTTDCICRCFYWLAYSGVDENVALEIRTSDVHFNTMEITHDGVSYPIYQESLPAMKVCVECESFNYKHPAYQMYKPRASGDKLLRGLTANRTLPSMQSDMSQRAKNRKFLPPGEENNERLNLNLGYYRVFISGLFHRTLELEVAGIEPDFTAAAKRFMEGKTYNLAKSTTSIESKQRSLAAEYYEDYVRWKMAYYG